MDEIIKGTTSLTPIDGYDDDESSTRSAAYLKFDGATPTRWFNRGDGSPAHLGPYFAPDVWEEHVKWIDNSVADRIRKVPGEPFPNVEDLNAKAPKSEWRTDFNDDPCGPWQHTFNIGLVDPDNGSRLIYLALSVMAIAPVSHEVTNPMILRQDEPSRYPDIQCASRTLSPGHLPRERFSPRVGSGHSSAPEADTRTRPTRRAHKDARHGWNGQR